MLCFNITSRSYFVLIGFQLIQNLTINSQKKVIIHNSTKSDILEKMVWFSLINVLLLGMVQDTSHKKIEYI